MHHFIHRRSWQSLCSCAGGGIALGFFCASYRTSYDVYYYSKAHPRQHGPDEQEQNQQYQHSGALLMGAQRCLQRFRLPSHFNNSPRSEVASCDSSQQREKERQQAGTKPARTCTDDDDDSHSNLNQQHRSNKAALSVGRQKHDDGERGSGDVGTNIGERDGEKKQAVGSEGGGGDGSGKEELKSPPSPLSSDEEAASLQIAAACFSKHIIVETFKDQKILDELINLLLKAIRRDEVKQAFAVFLKKQFVDGNQPDGSSETLRTFLLDSIIKDPWVNEQLVRLACDLGIEIYNHPKVWEELLAFLADTSWEGITHRAFTEEAVTAVKASIFKRGVDPSASPAKEAEEEMTGAKKKVS